MIAKSVYTLAGILLAVSLIGLRRASNDIAHSSLELPGGVPVVVWEPSPPVPLGTTPSFDPPAPVVVLCHGFAADNAMTSALARRIAKAGYAVVALDFRGHGENRNPLGPTANGLGLQQDIDAALLYARTQPRFDGQRVALVGHSMGAFAVLGHAQRDPGIGAVVAISGGRELGGPFAPPNAFFIWASGDPDRTRKRGAELAATLAGKAQIVEDKTYGEIERGSGVRMSEVPGTDHITILYSAEAAHRIVDWIATALGPGNGPPVTPGPDPRFLWSGLGLLAVGVLAFGAPRALAQLAPRIGLSRVERPLLQLLLVALALVGAVLLLSGFDSAAVRGPFSFVPLAAGRDLFGFFALAGALLLALGARGGKVAAEGLGDARTWLCAGLLFGLVYLAVGTLAAPFWDIFPAPHRLGWCLGATLLFLPYFGASEWLLRGPGRTGMILPAAGKALTLFAVIGGALAGLLPFVVLLGIVPITLFFVFFEVVALRLARWVANPWLAALFQAAFTAFAFTSIFPWEG
ncbi:MAG: alpha/beta fold hydrolase [Myxococcota bacterium]